MEQLSHTYNDSLELPEITEAELFAEMDAMRIGPSRRPSLTDEQYKVIHYGRTGKDIPVPWKNIHKWFAARYGEHIATTTLQSRYAREVEARAQDETSSIVFGMPKEAIEQEAAEKVVPLSDIAKTMIDLAQK